jgi:conjugal transfer mating pair stabilization protein TraN
MRCLDGNCIDKSYEMDENMSKSIAILDGSSKGKNAGSGFKIFEGQNMYCSKKAASYLNCCQLKGKGWGRELGAKCTKDEQILNDKRSDNLCVYIGKKRKFQLGLHIFTKHHYCCFSNLIEKIVQEQGRKQLGMNFGSASKPDCRGLTLEELQRVDFSKMDFSEMQDYFHKKMSLPDQKNLEGDIKDSFENMGEFNEDHIQSDTNKKAGINNKHYKEDNDD